VRRRVRRALAPLALLAGASCVWVPDHGYGCTWNRRGEIPAAARAALVPEGATRADVLCLLGEPDWISGDETRFVYWTREVSSWMLIYVIVDAATMVWGTDHYLLFEFDARGGLTVQREVTEPVGGFGGDNEALRPKKDLQTMFTDVVAPK